MKKIFLPVLFFSLCFSASAQHGKIHVEHVESKNIDARKVEIWCPEGYEDNKTQTYPVLYMQDGQNVFNPETATNGITWEAARTAQDLINQGKIEPIIIVAVWNSPERFFEYFPEKAAEYLTAQDKDEINKTVEELGGQKAQFTGDAYANFLAEELKPFMDEKFRTKPEQENTALCGSSMGGLISMYTLFEYQKLFGKAACLSTHWPVLMDNNNMNPSDAIRKYMELNVPDPKNHSLYFDYGTVGLDKNYELHQKMVDNLLIQSGYKKGENLVTKRIESGEHNEKSWQDRFDNVLLFLFKKK